eukprot:jgi/Tetstr1/436327/TSEL_025165.t1
MFKDEKVVCKVTPHPEAAVPTFGGKPIVSSVHRNEVVLLPLAGTTAASPKLHSLVGVLAQKRAGGILKHNTNAVNNLAATQAVPGDNVDEGCSPEPPGQEGQAARQAGGWSAVPGPGLCRGQGGRKQGNVMNYLARYYFHGEGDDGQGEAWQQTELGRYYQAGKCPPPDVMFKGEEVVCEKRTGGILKHNTNAVNNLAATQAVPGDNVDEGCCPEPPAKKVKQPAKPGAGVPSRGRGCAGARAGGGAFGSRAGRRAAVAAAATREQQASRRGGPAQNRM